ncbi:phosphoenolpyruvate--protein phosphotransferase [Telmatospirillum sp.]|uniref:phosphoenolpyruvate--protein phosphotransferase n=1 Tax=Telmatospirillum sp. TaxID=2079197 RepID=UPI00283EF75A|nr:phosphoenolpyruvate--protein phosphotransferase [Telmatospirillum sp.]MDR3440379.1 phosphoenolpyruvate--protein phosphotransferase [Telmatospirillum sp.]
MTAPPDPSRNPPAVSRQTEQVFHGLGVSPGVAIGVAHLHDSGNVTVQEYSIAADRLECERVRFADAVARASRQVSLLQRRARSLPGSSGEELSYLLDAYQQMLKNSRLVRGVDRRISEEKINAEAAVQREIDQIVQGFAAMDDAYLAARIEDIRDVGRRLVRNLTKTHFEPFAQLPKNAVILAEELTPADTALLDPTKVAGFATVLGGTASHTAIMARSLGLPAIVGMTGLSNRASEGVPAVIDGTEGKVILNPTDETLVFYRSKRAEFLKRRRQLHRLRKIPAITLDGATISLQANLELSAEIDGVLAAGAAGVGLLRSEFLYMNRQDLPSEDEQYGELLKLVQRLDGRTLTIRTLDAGGDKMPQALGFGEGPNPALGLRAIRLSLKHPEILETQLAAILRVGVHGPVRILLPMVSSVEELQAVRDAMGQVVRRLKRRHVPIATPLPPIGTMIEVPGAALAADALARHSDFFAIGTNDLTQYTLAIDRADESVAHLYNPLHPAVLRLIQFSAEAALRARIPVSVCGEIAGDPRYTALLLGLGIRELSMAAANIPQVKQRIRTLDLVAATRRVRVIMDQPDSRRIAQLLDDFNADCVPLSDGE